MLSLFERFESNVRCYCRDFPVVFKRAEQSFMFDVERNRYIDFLCGAGSLNYGHNHPHIKRAILDYINENGIMQSLDLYTEAKYLFVDALQSTILGPRGLAYKQQFTGPTGTNAVEAALKLARKVTGRSSVVAFTNAFHGVSLGALAATASAGKRRAAGVALDGVIRMPYQGFVHGEDDGRYVEAMLMDPGSGLDAPAAIILETVQGEGGLQTASAPWLQRIAAVAARVGALIIIDEIQTGCGRTGTFFSFEGLPIVPDIVCMSKSLSGIGLPLSVVFMAPKYDIWAPGEHNGTFRGNNLAFVSARAALDLWRDEAFLAGLRRNVEHLETRLQDIVQTFSHAGLVLKGRGMIRGLELSDPALAQQIKAEAFRRRLVLETCGPTDSVVKLMPPLTIEAEVLDEGLDILAKTIGHALAARPHHGHGDRGRRAIAVSAPPVTIDV
ncbi:MAG TPA: diaminobutyrate--2-oxoglutarate transaminase [Kofleriaceae bacterium]|jgi:diaminobutyrate-2-oxoglutarate transaminase|nr:diaminobutyrate--2-oxoglutarate transaminase [Kofleriaceae bacterium]